MGSGQGNPPAGLANPSLFAEAVDHHRAGRLMEAEALYQRVINANPQDSAALNNLGLLYATLDHVAEAEPLFQRAIAASPGNTDAYNNLGNLLLTRGDPVKAIALYNTARAVRPDDTKTLVNLGNALQQSGRVEEAIATYNEALRLDPSLVEAHSNLGNMLSMIGQYPLAITHYEKAIELRPNYGDAYNNLGQAHESMGRLTEATRCFEKALTLLALPLDATLNTGRLLSVQGKIAEAVATYEKLLQLKPGHPGALSNILFSLNYLDTIAPEAVTERHREMAAAIEAKVTVLPPPTPNRDPWRRLKVGYVSPDFRNHAVAFFLEPLLAAHDKAAVEVYAYAEVINPDAVTAKLRGLVDHWRPTVGINHEDLAAQIRADGIDILVDIAGHSAHHRLPVFAARPAPVQMTWLGYPNTTGMTRIDYRIVDAVSDPVGPADPLASEKLLRLDTGFLCYQPPEDAPPAAPPAFLETGARDSGVVTFGSFNNVSKLSPATLDTWAEVLKAVPKARLLLKSRLFGDEGVRADFMSRFTARGVDAERVDLLDGIPTVSGHLAAYSKIDIALDPFPYNGTTTTCEALWMGVPVIALAGDRHAARVSASLLTRVGLSELIAGSQDEYVRIAAALANDPERIARIHATLRPAMAASPLCDADGFARAIEGAYRTAWQTWCGIAPGTVPPPPAMPAQSGLKVDLGCGPRPAPGFMGVDILPGKGVDIVADLTQRFPFEDDTVSHLRAHDSLEHWPDRLHSMNEIWRVCQHGATVDIRVPSTDGRGAFQDPTHVSYWNINSFYYYCEDYPAYFSLCQSYGFKGRFKLVSLENVDSGDQVIHVHAILTAIKPDSPAARTRETLARDLAAGTASLDDAATAARYQALLLSPSLDTPLSPSEAALAETLADKPLAALLLKRPHTLQTLVDIAAIPAPVRVAVLTALNTPPGPFSQAGDVDAYRRFLTAWIARQHAVVTGDPASAAAQDIGRVMLATSNVIALYFTEANLKTVYQQRAAILEYGLGNEGHTLAHAFPPRAAGSKKRIGILLPAVVPRPESFATLPAFENLGDEFEVTLYVLQATGHRFEIYCKNRCQRFTVLPADLNGQAAAIRADDLDILFIGSNLTAVPNGLTRLAAHRLARVQMTSVGSVTTTGLSAIDVYLSGASVERAPEPQEQYSEKLVLLPDIAHCFAYGSEPAVTKAPLVTRDKLPLPPHRTLFASVANFYKLIPELLATWAALLAETPGSALMLFPYGSHWSETYPKAAFQATLTATLSQHGVEPNRVLVVDLPGLDRDDIRAFMGLADIYLDSFPFSGSTSIIEPLEARLPVVTLDGPCFRTAMATSLLASIGLDELSADDIADYRALAKRLAMDEVYRAQIAGRIKTAMAGTPPFLDAALYGQRVAQVFRDVIG